MKNSRKAWIIFRNILLVFFVVFLIDYFSVSSGYYEREIRNKTVLTDEKIKEFEEDVKNNQFVDIKDYVVDDYVDNSNFVSDMGYKFSEGVSDFIVNKAIKMFSFLGKMFV